MIENIKVYQDVLSAATVSRIIRTANDKWDFKDSQVIVDGKSFVDKSQRNVQDYNLIPSNKNMTDTNIYNIVKKQIIKAVHKYKQECCPNLHLDNILEITCLKYDPGGKYDMHVDSSKHIPRELSVIIFLNDDYVGGDLEFFNSFGQSLLKVKPYPGSAIIWPSNFMYPHRANPILSGRRYVLVSWLN